MVARSEHCEVEALLEISERVGRNPLLVQGNSGNTSVKLGDRLWIKASGKWLARAGCEEILVPVNMSGAPQRFKPGLAPSIETPMHLAIPVAATIHVHSVNTIAYAVLADGEQRLEDKLEGLPWAWIPYVASGLPLASEVNKVFAHAPETRILVLANHGLVVCGDDPRSTEDLLMEVEDRLAIEPRRAPKPDYNLLNCVIEASGWKLPQCESSHTLSTDAIARTLFQEGILYPCHAIFLGAAAPLLPADVPLSEGIRRYENDYGMTPRFFLIEGHGVIVSEAMTPAQGEMLRGMAEVAQRIDVDAEIRYLTPQEVSRVLEAEARNYLGETNPVLAGA